MYESWHKNFLFTERVRAVRQLLMLGLHQLQRILEGEGVNFMVRDERGELLRAGGQGEGGIGEVVRGMTMDVEDVRVVEQQVVSDARGELKRRMGEEVRREVRRELKREIREELVDEGRIEEVRRK